MRKKYWRIVKINKMDNFDEIRINDFIMSFYKEEVSDINYLKKYALENDVPIIRDETRDFLRMILLLIKPKNILEIGTAIGYSTLIINNACNEANIVTLEDYPKRIETAKNNFEKLKSFENANIKLVEGDATDYLKKEKKNNIYDFIFLDAAKGQYINWLPDILRLLRNDGVLLSDNVFKEGQILESRYLIRKRDRVIHKRMREFLYMICHDEKLQTYIYNIGDGISVSIKRGSN